MAVSPFQSAIEAVLKPLEFAARDDFSHIERVRNLAAGVVAAGERATALAIPRDVRERIREVTDEFAKAPEGASREAAIRNALETLRPLADSRWCETTLERSPAALSGVGPKRAEVLARRGMISVADMLFHLPGRWDDRRSLSKISALEVGLRFGSACF